MAKEKKIISKVKANKKRKEDELFTAAYELFATKGTNNTAIDEIVKKAGVAKGTFYLYFKDKYDIFNKLILKKSCEIAKEAMEKTEKANLEEFDEQVVFFINCLIDYFKENKLMLKLINKNFSNGLMRRFIKNREKDNQNTEIDEVARFFIDSLIGRGMDELEAELTLFMIFELVGSVCYSSVILGEPGDIDSIKPVLFKKVLSMTK